MVRHRLAELRSTPAPLFIYSDSVLSPDLAEWIQPPNLWTLMVYGHSGVAHVDILSIAFEPGDCVLYPPQARGGHAATGENCPHYCIQFGLAGGGERVALPLHAKLEPHLVDGLERAFRSMTAVDRHAQAFVWYLLWHISAPESEFRSRIELYRAEEWVKEHLHEPFQVDDLARAAGVSARTLSRLFRAEHHASVAQFVRDRRIREAVRLLTQTQTPIKQVAARIGVTTSQGFYCLIRDAIGISPSEVRRRAQGA